MHTPTDIASVSPPRRIPAQGFAWSDLPTRILVYSLTAAMVLHGFDVLQDSFPRNDGGMFLAMVQDLQRAHYALPWFTSYNEFGIPYAYPPLSFYLAGLLDHFTPLGALDALRFVPLLFNLLTIPVIHQLAQRVAGGRMTASLAVAIFVLLPDSRGWFLMGGGLSRAPGMFFALLCVYHLYSTLARNEHGHVGWALLAATTTVLTHPDSAWFCAVSCALLMACYARDRMALARCAAIGIGTALLTAPWWGTIAWRHGFAPFTAALCSGNQQSPILGLVTPLIFPTGTPQFTVIGALVFAGIVLSLIRRNWFVPLWYMVTFMFCSRGLAPKLVGPVSLASSVGLAYLFSEVLGPLMASQRLGAHHKGAIYSCIALMLFVPSVWSSQTFNDDFDHLGAEDREAMAWIAVHTPADSRFLVVPAGSWWMNAAAEWFPVLAHRYSVLTVQGTEWMPDSAFVRSIAATEDLDSHLGSPDLDWLPTWSAEHDAGHSHIFVSRTPIESARGADRDATRFETLLAKDPSYHLEFTNDRAAVYRYLGPGGSDIPATPPTYPCTP